MRKLALVMAVLSGFAVAQERRQREGRPLDPCGSPQEVFTKQMLDRCYKGYFDSIMESRRLAEEANRKADEASRRAEEARRRVGDLEGKVQRLESTASDHERRIRALEGRQAPTPAPAPGQRREEGVGPYRWQLEEVGVVYFDFDRFNIRPSESKKIEEMAEKLKGDSKEILVVGFADRRGSSRYNFNLSMWRAQMVASQLAKNGVDIGKIRVSAYGKEVAQLLGSKQSEQRIVKVYLIK